MPYSAVPFCAYCGAAVGQVSYSNCPSCGNPTNGAPRTAATSGVNVGVIVAIVGGLGLIVLILAAIAIPSLISAIDRAKQRGAMEEISAIGAEVEKYAAAHQHRYPDAIHIEQLAKQLDLELPTDDPWQHQYRYECWSSTEFGPCDFYGVASAGKDRKFTSEDWKSYVDRRPTSGFGEDIVFINGKFVQSPGGLD